MALLFIPWMVALSLAWRGHRREAIYAGLIALALCVAMFRYHTTDAIDINL